MADEPLHLDGNGVAGLLAEVFGADVTTARRECQGCGMTGEIGAHRAYTAAAVVLRCPGCGAVAARIAVRETERIVELRGGWLLRLPG